MGFWGSLGKGLLKAAPIAASFIPGVGPLVGAGLSAATGGLSPSRPPGANGFMPGEWDWNGGTMGGNAGGIGGFLGNIFGAGGSPRSSGNSTGIGPNRNIFQNMANAGRAPNNRNIFQNMAGKGLGPSNQGFDWKGLLGGLATGVGGGMLGGFLQDRMSGPDQPQGPMVGTSARYDGRMRGLGPVMGRRDQNNPNLAESIGAGRQDALRNQPFRSGYPVYSNELDPEGNPMPPVMMPPIYPTGRRLH